MARHELTPDELAALLVPDGNSPFSPSSTRDVLGAPVVVVDPCQPPPEAIRGFRLHEGVSAIVVGLHTPIAGDRPAELPLAPWCDLIASPDELDQIEHWATKHPIASLSLALLLRGAEERSLDEGLLAESATYSVLQAGPEFGAWVRSDAKPDPVTDPGPPLEAVRDGHTLTISLSRPRRANALDLSMREHLLEALAVALHDPSITAVVLRGDGPHYSTGGDLGEFGTFPDPATAHIIRLQTSIGRAIHHLSDRVTVHLHGTCSGSGIELPAFAGDVVAASDVSISLPEVAIGLVPGAGGTFSLPRRIGRHRTAWLALTTERIGLETAIEWGLVDRRQH
jgi:hypothetical protein